MSGPLDGIKVLDFGTWLQAPMAAAILGDLGADVIKAEQPVVGDPLRGLALGLLVGSEYRRNINFETVNRNKRGIVLDLEKQGGIEILSRLVRQSDVLIHSFRPRAAGRLGLDYETLSGLNPKLIYVHASAWGPKGPDSDKGAFDTAAAARVGLMYINGEPELPQPQRIPGGLCDVAGALNLVIATLAALQARERLGKGQMVDVSLFGSVITLTTWALSYCLGSGEAPPRLPRRDSTNPLFNFYRCADGEWIYLTMLGFERQWPAFCQAIGRKDLEKDSRCQDSRMVAKHARDVISVLDDLFATKPRAEWMRVLQEKDLFFTPIQRVSDLLNDPQVIANDYILEFEHPVRGREKVVGLPYEFGKTPSSVRRPCPEFGQHTEEVLLELGYTWDDIAGLKIEEVI